MVSSGSCRESIRNHCGGCNANVNQALVVSLSSWLCPSRLIIRGFRENIKIIYFGTLNFRRRLLCLLTENINILV